MIAKTHAGLAGRILLSIVHLLEVVEALVYIGSLTLLTLNIKSKFLFSDFYDDFPQHRMFKAYRRWTGRYTL